MSDLPRRVLVAGTSDAIDAVAGVLDAEVELLVARSLTEALAKLDARPDAVVCSVRFDESRMFDFLQALRERPTRPARKVICVRASPPPLAPATREAIEAALEALGIRTFFDFPTLAAERGLESARGLLRAAILG